MLFTKNRKAAPFDYARKWQLKLVFLLTIIFLYAPIVVLIIFSFNNSRRGGNVVWRGFTTCLLYTSPSPRD